MYLVNVNRFITLLVEGLKKLTHEVEVFLSDVIKCQKGEAGR
jgi:hypothetical protein